MNRLIENKEAIRGIAAERQVPVDVATQMYITENNLSNYAEELAEFKNQYEAIDDIEDFWRA